MSVYANGLLIHINEIVFLEFQEASQTYTGPVAKIAVNYEVLKQIHIAIGDALMQHDNRLAEVSKARSSMN